MTFNEPHEIISITSDRKYCSIRNTKSGQMHHMVKFSIGEDIDMNAIPVKVDNVSIGFFKRDGELVMANVVQMASDKDD